MGLRNSKKSVDIAASTGSPKKNGTEPTDVKVKELKEAVETTTAAAPEKTTEIIEEVAAKEDTVKQNGDSPPKEEILTNGQEVRLYI